MYCKTNGVHILKNRKKAFLFQFSEYIYETLTLCFTLSSLLCAEVIADLIFTVLLQASFRFQTSG